MNPGQKEKNIVIAVLPLQNMSEHPSINMFCTGFTMDLITDLSRFRTFDIIAFESVKDLHPNERLDSIPLKRLGVNYLVKGLMRNHQEQLLINLQLINAEQNRLVWAEKFSRPMNEFIHIQEAIVEKIVVSLQQSVDQDLLDENRKKKGTNLSAYECWISGFKELKKGTVEADERARHLFQKAMEVDPYYARAYTGMSLTYFNEWSCQLWSRWDVNRKGAFDWALKAVELDEQDHVSLAILGRIYLFNGEYEKAEHFIRKALSLNHNDAENLVLIAFGLAFLGYPEEAFQLYERAVRLNPVGEDMLFSCGAFIQFELGNYDEAIALGLKHQLGKGWVDFPAFMAAAAYMKGDLEKVDYYWQEYLLQFTQKINQGKPADTQTALQWIFDVNPYRDPSHLKPFRDYMGRGTMQRQSSGILRMPEEIKGSIRQEAGLWTFDFGGRQVQIPELKGFYDIERLLSAPEQSWHCTELMGTEVLEKGETVFDDRAKKEYQQRILDLQEELDEAGEFSQSNRVASLQQEYDQLLDHLTKSVGKGGKVRKASGSIEKARTAVTWRIRNAIKKIAEVHPQLGKHFEVSIKTGLFCTYSPETVVQWMV